MSEKIVSVGMRFFKGFISGAVTSMIMVTVAAPANWNELATILNIFAVAGIFGGINGGLLAVQKWYNWED